MEYIYKNISDISNLFSTRDCMTGTLELQQPQTTMQIEVPVANVKTNTPRETIDQEQHTVAPLGSNIMSVTDAVGTEKEIKESMHVDSKILHTSVDGLSPSIQNYLAKPSIITAGTFTSNDLPNSFTKYATSYPLTYGTIYKEKLSAVLSMRYTTVVTLQVNGTRFQQGIYKLCFLPTGGMLRDEDNPEQMVRYLFDHAANRSQISQLYSADLYIGTDTSVQLKIPFISAFPGVTVTRSPTMPVVGDPGVFFIYPYEPISAVAGQNTATFTLWVHYEDVELLGNTAPTAGPIMATMQGNFTKKLKKKNIDLLEEETNINGPISSPLKIISEASGILSKIPLLSGYAGTLSWATNAMASTVSSFGWSKPPILDTATRVKSTFMNYLPNADQKDDSIPMSLISTNHINVLPGFSGTDVDEMSIDYFKSIHGLLRIDTWAKESAQGSHLFTIDLAPQNFVFTGVGTNPNHKNFTPVGFLANMFGEYTGGFDFHFKFSKTEFHSGRLAVVFNPYESSVSVPNYTFDEISYLSKTIIDIRDLNEVTVRIPYVSVIPWRPTTTLANYGGTYGTLSVYVIDTLVAPETVTPEIKIYTEVSGADDLRFAVPRPNYLVRPKNATYQMATSEGGKLDSVGTAYVGDNTKQDIDLTKEEACVGETITSLRQILKRGGIMNTETLTSDVTQVTLHPFLYDISEGSPPTEYALGRDPYALFSSIYCLQRGGVRIKWMADTNSGMVYYKYDKNYTSPLLSAVLETSNNPYQHSVTSMVGAQFNMEKSYLGGLAASLPYYHYTHSSPCGAQAVNRSVPLLNKAATGANTNLLYIIFSYPLLRNKLFFHRSGADDCNFGGFVSIPPFAQAVTIPPAP